jgi:protein phosphatase
MPDSLDLQSEVTLKVLDCQPYQPTPLELLYGQQINPLVVVQRGEAIGDDSAAQSEHELSNASHQAPQIGEMPLIAQPYLALNAQMHPSLPQLHDAWEQDGYTVLLLADRLELPLLSEGWSNPDVQPLQILHWLYQMTELWGLLQPHGSAQSLLELSNVRVDEDQLICLQRLYFDHTDSPLSLKELGSVWETLFQTAPKTQLAPLVRLCQNLQTGDIPALDQLRSQFEAIANELQPSSMTIPPGSAYPLDDFDAPDEDSEPTMKLSSDLEDASLEIPPILPESDSVQTQVDVSAAQDEVATDGDDVPTVVLPMKLISLEDAGRSDVGRQRDHNEDYYSIQAEIKKVEGPSGRTLHVKGLYILCDGMGGHAGGEVASAMAVDTLKQYFEENWTDQLPNEATIRDAIYLANKSIYDLNQQNARSGSGRMGTTLVLVLLQDTHAAIAHVGDSRLYRFSRRRGLEQVTTDHEVGQREIQRGVEPAIAYARPDAYQLTQALGPRDENFVNPDVQFIELNEDLLLLLCSDGLTDNDLLETHWRTHLDPLLSVQTNLEHGVNQLIDLANHYNGHDNITAVVIRTKVRPNLEQVRR